MVLTGVAIMFVVLKWQGYIKLILYTKFELGYRFYCRFNIFRVLNICGGVIEEVK